jgi:hypothetical protein
MRMSELPPLPHKQEVARALLLKGTVFLHLDPRRPNVVVPVWLRGQPQLVLQVGLDMPVPIPDLRLDEEGIYATLSFNRAAFACSVPWEAVFAVVGDDGRGMVWPGSMPKEIAAEVEREARRARIVPSPDSPDGDRASVRRSRPPQRAPESAPPTPLASRTTSGLRAPSLELIAGDGAGARARQGERRRTPPHLRLVK